MRALNVTLLLLMLRTIKTAPKSKKIAAAYGGENILCSVIKFVLPLVDGWRRRRCWCRPTPATATTTATSATATATTCHHLAFIAKKVLSLFDATHCSILRTRCVLSARFVRRLLFKKNP